MVGWFIAGFVAGELVGLIVAAILTGTEGRKTEMSRKNFYIAMGIILAVMAALLVWAFSAEAEKEWDVECPMVNTNVSWEQTYYPGPWEGVRQ